ncbi:MAG: proline--tRNA ligase [Alphaproteobacteria bacterium]|jgi:prolyl-tRNA synthetase|tara:strand:+ start:1404 stop:2678 length:1275 start_codon:yes stop_codon:yes gene_type:complete
MKFSNFIINTLKESPKEAQIISHKLMLRTSMVKQHTAGIYIWLPLGLRVLRKIENIVRNNQDDIGCQELLMPTIQSSELWKKSGRYDDYGKEMLRMTDRHDSELLYGPTNEEVVTDFFNDYVNSYKNLPKYLYHIQWKFRDEIRPRFGVMRGREFLMKDAYSFDLSESAAFDTYKIFYKNYLKTFIDLGLKPIPVKADSGAIGGNLSHEFQILANTGESEIAYDPQLTANNLLDQSYEEINNLYSASDDLIDKSKIDIVIGRGIEVGHIFYFGTKYSTPLGARMINKDGKNEDLHMGSYGIGVSRLVGAIIEAHHDEKGIVWPFQIAPFKINIIASEELLQNDKILNAYTFLLNKYKDVILDDRSITFGKKIKDTELIGIPWTIIAGKNYSESGHLELLNRRTNENIKISLNDLEKFDFEKNFS